MGLEIDFLKDKYLGIEAYYSKEYTNFDMETHRHPYLEIMYIDSGACEVNFIENYNNISHKKSFILKKGQFIFINYMTFHKMIVTDKEKCKIFNLEFNFVSENDNSFVVKDLYNLILNVPRLNELFTNKNGYAIYNDHHDILGLIKLIHRIISNEDILFEEKIILQLRIWELFAYISTLEPIDNTIKSISHIKKAIKYIFENYDQADIEIQKIADYIGINKVYLISLFKKHTGISIVQYINKLRIKKALELIKNTNLNLTDIGFECGFNSRQSFFITFKKLLSKNPSEIKNEYHKNELYSYKNTYINQFINELDKITND